jgi:NTE family protein
MTTAFVLQGGAALAAGQVGMLRALVEAGIRPDLVVGTSAGALNAVAFAQDPTLRGIAHLESIWTRVRRRDVFPVHPRTLLAGVTGRGDGLVSSAGLRRWLETGLSVRDLGDTAVAAAVVATDTATGEEVALTAGPVVEALLASAAVPGVFPGVAWQGRTLVDGGLVADLPVRAARRLGADTVYVLPRAVSEPGRGPMTAALRALDHLLAATSRDALGGPGVVVLPAPRTDARSPFDFRHAAATIAEGYRGARSLLATPARSLALAA